MISVSPQSTISERLLVCAHGATMHSIYCSSMLILTKTLLSHSLLSSPFHSFLCDTQINQSLDCLGFGGWKWKHYRRVSPPQKSTSLTVVLSLYIKIILADGNKTNLSRDSIPNSTLQAVDLYPAASRGWHYSQTKTNSAHTGIWERHSIWVGQIKAGERWQKQ